MATTHGLQLPPPGTCHTDPQWRIKTRGETYLNTGTSRNQEAGRRGPTAGKREFFVDFDDFFYVLEKSRIPRWQTKMAVAQK